MIKLGENVKELNKCKHSKINPFPNTSFGRPFQIQRSCSQQLKYGY